MVALSIEDFGTVNDEKVKKFTWNAKSGLSVSVITYGAIVQSIKVPDKNGLLSDVVFGFDNINDYQNGNVHHFGSTIGRCANRIAGATFEINDVQYSLTKNLGKDHLHGGERGFDQVNWDSVVDGSKVILSYLSRDLEEGYPGDLAVSVIYEVKDDGTFCVEFIATTLKTTVVNLTNHSYFNLGGHEAGANAIYDHMVTINADKITETTSESIPTGKYIRVGGTSYDFRAPKRLGDAMKGNSELFDNNFCIATYKEKTLTFISRVSHPPSGRYLEMYSDQPGVQLYTSNFLPGASDTAIVGKKGAEYRRHGAFCLETQLYPDAVHHPRFPSSILKPGEVYQHRVTYRFGVDIEDQPEYVEF